jgi:hypothetical protein
MTKTTRPANTCPPGASIAAHATEKPERRKVTVYLSEDTRRRLRVYAATIDAEMSVITEEAIKAHLDGLGH